MKAYPVKETLTGGISLHPDHPTLEHILPKCYYPELTKDPDNIVATCWDCNKSKGSSLVEASQIRHYRLMHKLEHLIKQLK